MATAKGDWLDRLFALHALMGSTYQAERDTAQQKLLKLLGSHGKGWNDVPELLEIVIKRRGSPTPPPPPPAPHPAGAPLTGRRLFDGIRATVQAYLSLEPDEYVAYTLWAMHTHVCRQFMFTPRLFLSSGVRGCGKTTALDILNGVVAYPRKSDNLTAPTFFRWTNTGDSSWGPTILIDEVDNLGLLSDRNFRAALNSGYRQGGSIQRTIHNWPETFKTFAPVALAGIGMVPLPLARRAIVIQLKRDPQALLHLKQFDSLAPDQIEMFELISAQLSHWAASCELTRTPVMPPELTSSQADAWRVLIAIADACDPEIGELARAVAVRMSRDLDEDPEILLLRDIRDLFDQRRVDRLASTVIVESLNQLPHGLWSDWRGKNNTDTPRPLTMGIMAQLLVVFRIRPVTIWPLNRTSTSKSSRGYHRHQFEDSWQRYCSDPETDTSTRSGKIRYLRRHVRDT